MRARHITVIVAVIALALGITGSAMAEDFTITIPVKVLNLAPPDTGGVVSCMAGVGTAWTLETRVGGGQAAYTADANGNYQSNVVVKFNAQPGKNPATATHWTCSLYIGTPTGSQRADLVAPSKGKTGAPVVATASGQLP